MTTMKRLPLLDGGKGLGISMDNSVSGSDAGNSVSGVVWRRRASRFCAQVLHLVTVLCISVIIVAQ